MPPRLFQTNLNTDVRFLIYDFLLENHTISFSIYTNQHPLKNLRKAFPALKNEIDQWTSKQRLHPRYGPVGDTTRFYDRSSDLKAGYSSLVSNANLRLESIDPKGFSYKDVRHLVFHCTDPLPGSLDLAGYPNGLPPLQYYEYSNRFKRVLSQFKSCAPHLQSFEIGLLPSKEKPHIFETFDTSSCIDPILFEKNHPGVPWDNRNTNRTHDDCCAFPAFTRTGPQHLLGDNGCSGWWP